MIRTAQVTAFLSPPHASVFLQAVWDRYSPAAPKELEVVIHITLICLVANHVLIIWCGQPLSGPFLAKPLCNKARIFSKYSQGCVPVWLASLHYFCVKTSLAPAVPGICV